MEIRPKVVVFDAFNTTVQITRKNSGWEEFLSAAGMQLGGKAVSNAYRDLIMSHNVGPTGLMSLIGRQTVQIDMLCRLESLIYREAESVDVYPDTCQILHALRERGYKIGICSNLAQPYGHSVRLLLREYVDEFFFSYEMHLVKPDPSMYKAVGQRFRVDMEEIAFIGDNWQNDFAMPRAMGMNAVWLQRNKDLSFYEQNPQAIGHLEQLLIAL